MTQFRDFEDIHAWQESRILIRKIRQICKRECVRKDFAFIDQITRSARSIAANIAEGNDAMTTPAFIEFLGYAKRSCAEVRAHLYDALDENYISKDEFSEYANHSKVICRMIAKLIHYLQSLEKNHKRTYTASNKPKTN